MNFDEISGTLLVPVSKNNKLVFKSDKTGVEYEANDENSLLYSENNSSEQLLKYKNIILAAAFTPTAPRIKLEKGCPNCSRLVVSYIRVGEDQKMVYTCLCGNVWNIEK